VTQGKSIASRFRRGAVVGLALGAILYVAYAVALGWREVVGALSAFLWGWLPLLLLLSLANYALRFLRWQSYLRALGIRIPVGSSVAIFVAGLAMSVTPGKIGEFLKSYLLREAHAVPMARSAPLVFAERVTDLFALLLLASFGVASYGGPSAIPILLAAAAALGFGVALLQSRVLSGRALSLLARLPVGRRVAPRIEEALDASRILLAPRPFAAGLLLATLAWLCECWEYGLAFTAFGVDGFRFPVAVFAYSFSTVAGVVSPGGIGPTDVGLIELARRFTPGLPREVATAASFLVRVCTLWFAVALGAAALLRFRQTVAADAEDAARLSLRGSEPHAPPVPNGP
jgi:uncharacterized protein (TIRG00374 family)